MAHRETLTGPWMASSTSSIVTSAGSLFSTRPPRAPRTVLMSPAFTRSCWMLRANAYGMSSFSAISETETYSSPLL